MPSVVETCPCPVGCTKRHPLCAVEQIKSLRSKLERSNDAYNDAFAEVQRLEARLQDAEDACAVWRRENAELRSTLSRLRDAALETAEALKSPDGASYEDAVRLQRLIREASE